jgi:HEAT repeat protein
MDTDAMTDAASDFIEADRYSVRDLRDGVFRGKGSLSRPLALSLLRSKEYPRKVQDLEHLLTDENEEPRIRNLAAQILGEMGTPKAIDALERGLGSKEELTLRGVIKGLTTAGRSDAVPALRRLARRKGPVGEAAAGAANLLSHRSGD